MTSWPRGSVKKSIAAAGIIFLGVIPAGGCAAAQPVATCQEFAAMSPDTGLLTSTNTEQEDAIKHALRTKNLDDGFTNRSKAKIRILAYCNIYDGKSSSHSDSPISEALG